MASSLILASLALGHHPFVSVMPLGLTLLQNSLEAIRGPLVLYTYQIKAAKLIESVKSTVQRVEMWGTLPKRHPIQHPLADVE